MRAHGGSAVTAFVSGSSLLPYSPSAPSRHRLRSQREFPALPAGGELTPGTGRPHPGGQVQSLLGCPCLQHPREHVRLESSDCCRAQAKASSYTELTGAMPCEITDKPMGKKRHSCAAIHVALCSRGSENTGAICPRADACPRQAASPGNDAHLCWGWCSPGVGGLPRGGSSFKGGCLRP